MTADGSEWSSPIHAALQRLDERLSVGDGAGALEAVDGVEAALTTMTAEGAGGAEALLPELDAMRLMLDEVRFSVRGPVDPEQH
jgi:hypothetical protein